ncbi:MAG: hypothetical protein A3G93_08405 [Nitrospinae bacterium RIFCSPLOWO2_12_FULL_45_22]|nr:MAG: hypothetical protein A3G93_08405 [Nitrospinae bacterium RIFCSPLOWO2_12_FULL_45_22]
MQYYGFTDKELDFIINYDIKYRRGLDKKGELLEIKAWRKGEFQTLPSCEERNATTGDTVSLA